jgi:hypothetical protein
MKEFGTETAITVSGATRRNCWGRHPPHANLVANRKVGFFVDVEASDGNR